MANNEKETLEETEVKEVKEEKTNEVSKKDQVEKKIRKQIEKKQEKEAHGGISRIGEYLKEEHKWESYVFIVIALITLFVFSLAVLFNLSLLDSTVKPSTVISKSLST